MRPKVYSLVLTVAMMTVAPQAVMAQGVKKDKWVEAVYPGGEWLLPLVEGKVVQIRLAVNRYNIPASLPNHTPGWGDIELSDIDLNVEGQLGAPMQIGDVYYFDITSKKGSGRIGIKKFRDNPKDDPYVKIMDVSGAITKWVKKDSKLRPYQGNGRMSNPTIYAMTEKELDNILKRCNNENYIDYNWWMMNRNGFSYTTAASSTGNNRGNTTQSSQGTVSLKGLMKASGLTPQQGQPAQSSNPQPSISQTTATQRTTTTASNSSAVQGELGLFELRGPVKTCVWKNSEGTATHGFDRKGMWISENGMKPWAGQESVKRDRQGRIVKMGDSYDEEYESFAYNANGLISKRIKKYMDGLFQTNYVYNSKGECTKSVLEFEDMGDTGKETTSYTILSRDSYGNWTKRKTHKGVVETRTITYYL